jgi:diguanylate cyclase (GGDEF)-like protein
MISLKQYLEQNPDKLLRLSLDAYRETLDAVAEGGLRCCPSTGETLKSQLASAAQAIKNDSTVGTLRSAHQEAVKALRRWGEHSEAYFKRKTAEVKEILTELAATGEYFCKRDQRYSQQIHQISEKLEAIAHLDDLSWIRSSLLHNVAELKGCVERMTREGNESIAHLKSSLASYQVQLDQAQELAALDPLTGLYNRRAVEARIAARLASNSPFCVVIIDLDDFKQINDRHGHLAGDELLRQIASELRLASRAEDIIGRWGGDEFILLLDGSFTNTKIKVERMRPWVFGNYELDLAGSQLSVFVNASIGMAEWAPGETMLQVLSRADAEMYRHKAVTR